MTDSQADGRPTELVAIGGGNGSSQVALSAQPFFAQISVVVAVTDTGRSTGVARSLADTPAPGDLRNTLATLARDPQGLWPRLLQQRFHSAQHRALDGMALGNLALVALTEQLGDIASASAALAELLDPIAQVLPASTANAQLCAELADGSTVRGELAVRGLGKPAIRRVFLEQPAPAYDGAIAAIMSADLVAIGPGSFFTSVQAALCFEGLAEALRRTPATVAFVCNSTTQPGQTDGMGVFDHVRSLAELLGPGALDVALINRSPDLDPQLLASYAAEGLHLLSPADAEIAQVAELGVRPLVRELVRRGAGRQALWNKLDTISYDRGLLGAALAELAGG
jgi:uncharacterized cofD-like protein